jgi:hypothetical protein
VPQEELMRSRIAEFRSHDFVLERCKRLGAGFQATVAPRGVPNSSAKPLECLSDCKFCGFK